MPKPPKMKGWQVGLISVVISIIIMFIFWQLGYVKTDWRETEEEEEEAGEERRLTQKSVKAKAAARQRREEFERMEGLKKRQRVRALADADNAQRAHLQRAHLQQQQGHDESSFIQT